MTNRSLARSLLAALTALALGCGGGKESPTTFAEPEDAVEALLDAVESNDTEAILQILGDDYRNAIITSDWDATLDERKEIVAAARESWELVPVGEDRDELVIVIGALEWPSPFPLVEREGGWQFDTASGIEEVIARRIGRNELRAIAIANAYVDAQIEYAREDRDGDDVLEYAQRLASTPGQRDGLYWESGDGQPESPFGPLVVGAEGYLATRERGDPIWGYYFEILTGQGENAPGGEYDYVINGNMVAGFALVAYPAEYGNTGVMTFVVNQRGKVHEMDDGGQFDGMDAYDPGDGWTLVEEAGQ